MDKEFLPGRLKKARERLNLNKAQAARLLGLSPIGYLRYEQGLRSPSVQMLEVISQQFKTSVDYLTGKTDEPDADSVVIYKKENKELFQLAIELKNADNSLIKRLCAYYIGLK